MILYDLMDCRPTRLPCPWDSPGKNSGVGFHSLLQGIFPTQGLNPGLLHCRFFTIWATREAPKRSSTRSGVQTPAGTCPLDLKSNPLNTRPSQLWASITDWISIQAWTHVIFKSKVHREAPDERDLTIGWELGKGETQLYRVSLVAQTIKSLLAMQVTWVGKIPWRRAWQPTPVFMPGDFHGQRSLASYTMASQRVRRYWVTNTFHFRKRKNPEVWDLLISEA